MTPDEHHSRIVAKCRALIALVDKRWLPELAAIYTEPAILQEVVLRRAVAGWMSTIAAIEALRTIQEEGFAVCSKALAEIRNAFPEEPL